MYKMKSRGLGDSIEKFTKFTGIKMSSHLRARKGKASVYLQRGMSDEISYEDVLLAQYMDEIQKSPPVRKER